MYSVSVSTVAWVLILEPVWSHSPISVKLQIHSGKAFIENYVTVAFVRLCIGNALQAKIAAQETHHASTLLALNDKLEFLLCGISES